MKLIEFPVSELEVWLPNIWPLLKEACEHSSGKYQPMDIVRQIAAKRMQLWNAVEDNKIYAIGITEVMQYPHAKVCRLLCATGEDSNLWTDLLPKLEEWAKEIGCAYLEPVCRPGWQKFLKKAGYTVQHYILEKKL